MQHEIARDQPIFSSNRKRVSLFLPEIGPNPKLDTNAAEKKFLSRTSLGHLPQAAKRSPANSYRALSIPIKRSQNKSP